MLIVLRLTRRLVAGVHFKYVRLVLYFLICFLLWGQSGVAFFSMVLHDPVRIEIISDYQSIDVQEVFSAQGKVKVCINELVWIKADRLFYDKKKQKLFLYGGVNRPIQIQKGDFFLYTQQLVCDIKQQKCFLGKLQCYYKKCRLCAAKGSLSFDGEGTLESLCFTSCKKVVHPHWQFCIKKAFLKKEGIISVAGVSCAVGTFFSIPLPISSFSYALKPESGFLMPSFIAETYGGIGCEIPYYFLGEFVDLKSTLQVRSKKGVVLSQRLRGFTDFFSGEMWGGYGSVWGYDKGVEGERIDRQPFFLEGLVYGKYKKNAQELVWYSKADEGWLHDNGYVTPFKRDFWQNRYSSYQVGCDWKGDSAAVYGGMHRLYSGEIISNPQGRYEKVYNEAIYIPQVLVATGIESKKGGWQTHGTCFVDGLKITEKKVRVEAPYHDTESLLQYEYDVIRMRINMDVYLQQKSRSHVFFTKISPGFLVYSGEEEIWGTPLLKVQNTFAFPEYLFLLKETMMYRYSALVESMWQPLLVQSNESVKRYGYDCYDYRYHESKVWLKQSITASFLPYFYLLSIFDQGIDFSNSSRGDRRVRNFGNGVAFPWYMFLEVDAYGYGYSLSIDGEWSSIKWLHAISMVFKGSIGTKVRFNIRYTYLDRDSARLRNLYDSGHFCTFGSTILSGAFEGEYKVTIQALPDEFLLYQCFLRKQEAKVLWKFDCWHIGLGVACDRYTIGEMWNTAWHGSLSVKLLFS